MRRKDREKDEAFALELLKNCEYATLATADIETSGAYCVTISQVLEGKTLYFHCAPEGKKIDNIEKNPNVCISCVGKTNLVPDKFSTEFESAVAFGTCTKVESDEEKIHALRLVCEKYALSNMENFEKAAVGSLGRTSVYKVELAQVTGKARVV